MYDLKQFLQLTDEQQQQQMCKLLSSLATTSEEQRQEGLRQLMLATSQLDTSDKIKVIEARVWALTKLPEEQIKTIFRSRAQAMQGLTEISDADRNLVFTVVQQMPVDVQRTFVQIISELRGR